MVNVDVTSQGMWARESNVVYEDPLRTEERGRSDGVRECG